MAKAVPDGVAEALSCTLHSSGTARNSGYRLDTVSFKHYLKEFHAIFGIAPAPTHTKGARDMTQSFQIVPVGHVRKKQDRSFIHVDRPFTDALLGLGGFSHIWVLYWFHENDTPEKRATLRVHPMKDPSNPLTGVFATHSPARPNLIALSRCRIRSIEGAMIELDDIDAVDGSPVLDIKCYIPDSGPIADVRTPTWVQRGDKK
ncbi:tRNA (adenine(37)-N6)-methyltransferase [Olavius algarvensis associated proteobacterium Delta 3]|nr:tRNA (adenine(37)-N6)-methyltransferase [Olavius algarvensis associated proteobacterium Delta 3]CAB5125959.1 tRNA (adenine(37)-N6)-methyltransferase [Olavius algarvensis associated proteobacterium Delta 3]